MNELKTKAPIHNDYQQIYIGEFATGIFINKDAKIKSKIITQNSDFDVKIMSEDKIELEATELITPVKITSKSDDSAGQKGSFSIECEADGDLSISNTDADTQNNISIHSQNHVILRADSGRLYLYDADNHPNFEINGEFLYFNGSNSDAGDGFRVRVEANGVTTVATNDFNLSSDSNAHMTIQPDGNLILSAETDNHIKLDRGTGFTQGSASSATDVAIDFRDTQKYLLTMSGNVTNLNMTFPAVSGNFTLLVQQDSSTRTITNYNVKDSGGSNASGGATVKFAGGSNPDLTDGGNKVDIISMYWDATNECCYGVASLNFY